MKRIYLFAVIIVVGITSCNNKKETSSIESTSDDDCLCNQLNMTTVNENGEEVENWKDIMKDGKAYTGNCIEKDQNDTIIRKLEFKNGWVVREIKKENVLDNIYTITNDMQYKQLQKDKGFHKGLSLLIAGDKIRYISDYQEYKNGNLYDKWSIGASDNSISISRYAMKGEMINYWNERDSISTNFRTRPKCLADAELFNGSQNEMEWTKNNISEEDFYKTLDCLKEELKPFTYWKVK